MLHAVTGMKHREIAALLELTLPTVLSKYHRALKTSILAILAGLLVGLIVLLATNPSNAFPAFSALITGGFYSGMKTFGNVLYYAVPIIMTGLGVGFGFKASIFNIGGAGQFIVGAFCGVYTASVWNLPGAIGQDLTRIFH